MSLPNRFDFTAIGFFKEGSVSRVGGLSVSIGYFLSVVF